MTVDLTRVFVYGTLKTNQPNHYWLGHQNGASRLVANGKTQDKYPMVIATRYNIPYLVKLTKSIGNAINGEIYEVDEQMLGKLDELEGHPNYYLRQQITINGVDG